MLYEFQLNDLESANVTPHRRLTEVEVPFNTVVGLWLYDKEMRLEVNTAPTMCLGSKILEKHTKIGVHAPAAVYDRHQMVDLTNGEMKTVPYHYVGVYQDSHRLEKSLKIKSALKSTVKSLKSLGKSLNSTIFCRTLWC